MLLSIFLIQKSKTDLQLAMGRQSHQETNSNKVADTGNGGGGFLLILRSCPTKPPHIAPLVGLGSANKTVSETLSFGTNAKSKLEEYKHVFFLCALWLDTQPPFRI